MILPNISLLVEGTTLELQSLNAMLQMVVVLILMMVVGAIVAKKRSYFLQY